jgi:putative transposase
MFIKKQHEYVVKQYTTVYVKAVFHRDFEGELKTSIVARYFKRHCYISIPVEDGAAIPLKQKFSKSTTVGVYVGIKDFALLSTGKKITNPKYLKNSLQRSKILQKRASKKRLQGQSKGFKAFFLATYGT